MSKDARGVFAADDKYFGGYFDIDGVQYLYAGAFEHSIPRPVEARPVILEYDDVKELSGVYTIGSDSPRIYNNVNLPLTKGSSSLRIASEFWVKPDHYSVSGHLAWLPPQKIE